MRTKLRSWLMWLALPVAIGGMVYASVQAGSSVTHNSDGFVCPVTGEELACPKCCPLK